MTVLEHFAVLDFPLQSLTGVVPALIFRRRGDRLWVALVKGILVSFVVIIILSVIFWITS